MRIILYVFITCFLFILYACSTTPVKNVKATDIISDQEFKIENSTNIKIKPSKGYAVVYNPLFHGRYTASGEIFDKTVFTAAHSTLPFGEEVRVTYIATGKSEVVIINDRLLGDISNKENILIQITPATAEKLGIAVTDKVEVKLSLSSEIHIPKSTQIPNVLQQDIVSEPPPLPEFLDIPSEESSSIYSFIGASPKKGTYILQLGAFLVKENAYKFKNRKTSVYPRKIFFIGKKLDYYCVLIGEFMTYDEAFSFFYELKNQGVDTLSPFHVK